MQHRLFRTATIMISTYVHANSGVLMGYCHLNNGDNRVVSVHKRISQVLSTNST